MSEIVAISPLDGAELGRYEVTPAEKVNEAVNRGRVAFSSWRETSLSERVATLRSLRLAIVSALDEIVEVIARATGKPDQEALGAEVLTTVDALLHYEKYAESYLSKERRRGGLLFFRSQFTVLYEPLGVVGVIGPWNYPFYLCMVPVISALVAGNAVVLKPSEVTPGVGELIESLMRRAGLPEGVFQVVQGRGETGAALVDARPDKVFFTGSVATGRQVMQSAARHLIPVSLELGGKDPMLVFADAPFKRAVQGAVYGGFANAGQICVSVERLYLEEKIHDRFVGELVARVSKLRVGSGRGSDYGPMTTRAQLEHVEALIEDALAKGARMATPGGRLGGQGLRPVVLTECTHEMRVLNEETFGPVLPVLSFKDEGEAVSLANESDFGLSASIWTRNLRRARRVAGRLEAGNVAVNDVIKNIANHDMPFGGVKKSGIGRYHGREGLRAFSRQKSLMINDGRLPREINWFPNTPFAYAMLSRYLKAVYGGSPMLRKPALFQTLRETLME